MAHDRYWNYCHRGRAHNPNNRNIGRTHHTIVRRVRRDIRCTRFAYKIGVSDHEASSWALELKFKTSIGAHTGGSGVRTKGETTVASMSLGERYLQEVWADDKAARETHYTKRG